jgi:DNA-directed RNA polymerase specialized sigma24 family protein
VLPIRPRTGRKRDDVDEREWLAERFERERAHLRGVAFRMLGSLPEADDAVQETWLRLSRAQADGVENLQAWLTTVLARVCLNQLRSRQRREGRGDRRPGRSRPARPSCHAGLIRVRQRWDQRVAAHAAGPAMGVAVDGRLKARVLLARIPTRATNDPITVIQTKPQ